VKSVKKLVGITLVGLLTVIPLGFPKASSDLSLRWDERGRLILPDGYTRMTDEEYLVWFCNKYPNRCEEKAAGILPEEDYSRNGGGGI